ncbi:hypothetical protein ABPG75_002601 [Micractinium tetrahymenae]
MAAVNVMGPRPMVLAAATQHHSSPPPPAARPTFDIRPSQLRDDLQRAAWLRAEAYYENRSVGRFKQSFIKQFAGQELYALLRRTQGASPQCTALVASLEGSSLAGGPAGSEAGPGGCIGTLDVRLLDPSDPFASASWPDGVPLEPLTAAPAAAEAGAAAAYVSNVVVAPAQRGRGLGRRLVAAGLEAAQQRWGAAQVYCHVEVDNEAALALYRGSGFCQLGEELPPAEEGLAKRLLLCRQLAEA